jgi:hypothetical protein
MNDFDETTDRLVLWLNHQRHLEDLEPARGRGLDLLAAEWGLRRRWYEWDRLFRARINRGLRHYFTPEQSWRNRAAGISLWAYIWDRVVLSRIYWK